MERRKENRIKIKSDSFITRFDSAKTIGRIVDISLSGLGFHYLESDAGHEHFSCRLGILLKEQNLFLPDILVNTVSDFQVQYKTPFEDIHLRRRGVQFCRLSARQYSQIHYVYYNLLPIGCMQTALNFQQPRLS
jgi:c-di-GMP-binding flagellar brake protein YcgR